MILITLCPYIVTRVYHYLLTKCVHPDSKRLTTVRIAMFTSKDKRGNHILVRPNKLVVAPWRTPKTGPRKVSNTKRHIMRIVLACSNRIINPLGEKFIALCDENLRSLMPKAFNPSDKLITTRRLLAVFFLIFPVSFRMVKHGCWGEFQLHYLFQLVRVVLLPEAHTM